MKLLTSVLFALTLVPAAGAFAHEGHEGGHKCNCSEKCAHHAKNEKGGHSCSGDCKGCEHGTCNDKTCAEGHDHGHDHHHGHGKPAKKKG